MVVTGEAGAPVGIVTDRDIALKAVAWKHGPETPVTEVMSQPLETMPIDSGRSDIIAHMSALGIRRLPLTRDGELVGFVSLEDLAYDLAEELDHLNQAVSTSLRRARRHARVGELSREAEEAIVDLRDRLRYAGWMTRERFLDELDELRDRVAKAMLTQSS